jgi:hypothetical protein
VKSILVMACALALGLGACGGGDDSGANKSSGSAASGQEGGAANPKVAAARKKASKQAARSFAAAAGEAKSEPGVAGRGSFNQVVAELPIRSQPLPIQQYIIEQGHSLIARPETRDFYCGRSVAQRFAAVEAFYREADRVFRAGGVKDFVQVVTSLSRTTEKLPAFAIGRNGSVSLTRLARGPC